MWCPKGRSGQNWEGGDWVRSLRWVFLPLLLPRSSGPPPPLTCCLLTSTDVLPLCVLQNILHIAARVVVFFKAPIRTWFPLPKTLQWVPSKLTGLARSASCLPFATILPHHSSLPWTSQSLSCLWLLRVQFLLPGRLFQPAPAWIQDLSSAGFPSPPIILCAVSVLYFPLNTRHLWNYVSFIYFLSLFHDLSSLRVNFSLVLFTMDLQWLIEATEQDFYI